MITLKIYVHPIHAWIVKTKNLDRVILYISLPLSGYLVHKSIL